MYLSAIRRRPSSEDGFPWNVPVVAGLDTLEFDRPVTFFVGENGSGKSTVLEGIAAGMRAIAVGSADMKDDESRIVRSIRRVKPKTSSARKKSFVRGCRRRSNRNPAANRRAARSDLSDIEEEFRRELPDGSYGQKLAMGSARGQRLALEGRYGADPDARSHGEVFLTLLASRLSPGGLHFLDEPEGPLSPRGVLQLIALIKDRVARDCQFIIATHSPMLMAFPDATIYVFDDATIRRTPYPEVEHVQLVKMFLNDPQRFLQHF